MRASNGRLSNARQILAAALCLLILPAAGCSGECSNGDSRCQGDAISWCSKDPGPLSRPTWHERQCPVTCREVAGAADCVDSTEPLPACANAAHDVCFNGVPARCWGEYPIQRPACDPGTHCVVSTMCGAVCAVDDNPDPGCAGDANRQGGRPYCDAGRVLTSCYCDFVTRRRDCGGADLCRELGGYPECTLSSTPDPRCGEPAAGNAGFCVDNVGYSCWLGFVVQVTDCGGNRCTESPGSTPNCEPTTPR